MTTMTAPIATLEDLRGRRALVLGLARSGTAVARMLADAGADVAAYDRRPPAELAEAVQALGGRSVRLALGVSADEARTLIGAADLLVTSPSISPTMPTTDAWLRAAINEAIGQGVELVSEVDLFLRLTRARVLAVTGTKGKTTTASLIGAIMDAAGIAHLVGGNIGRPLIDEVGRLGPDDWAVLELSELQLPTISRGAEIAVYTNIGADHLDRHGTEEAYRAVKARLAELSVRHGHVVLNADDPGSRELGARLPAASIAWYALVADDAWMAARLVDGWLTIRGERVLAAAEVPIPGRHTLADALAAALAASLAGASNEAIAAGIRDFGGVPHRLERVATRQGVAWVNDSQATIPMAAIAALEAFAPAPVVLIAGGKDKGLDYGAFADAIARRCRAAVLIGETANRLEELIARRVPVVRAEAMRDAVAAAAAWANAGDVVLLAPAAASFDMFDDYAARGDAFRDAVRALDAAEPLEPEA
ncbi:MAG TPA: UDP-N-acetylmuramoyl-L-alanine--D-glutamate ligase [Candidatus Limnocylindria bacterium]|nr:UDP-N-acetylmuramoyl-L-alanine--D-glutamate ligase [Candidatus Limnocylindria bacterium]